MGALLSRLARAFALAAAVLATAGAATAHALDDGLARTPPLGWNNWYATFCDVDEQLIKQTADAMVASGMRDAGYRYVNIDDCWMAPERDANGRLQPDRDKFPNGIKALANYVHARGLKLGIYEDVGTKTCAGYPGSLGYEEIDARTFAEWEIDFVKVDWCNVPFDQFPGMSQQDVAKELYGRWSRAIQNSGRKMVFSICIWDPTVRAWEFSEPLAHMWRTGHDYGPTWGQVLANADHAETLGEYAGPGGWNDPDILMVGLGDLTTEEDRSHFSLWSMLAAPLLAGSDLRTMTWQDREILTNREVLAVDQDRLGIPGRKLRVEGDTEVWSRPLANGDRAVLLFNRSSSQRLIDTTAEEVGLPQRARYQVRDLWRHETRESAGRLSSFVPGHGVTMLRVGTRGGAAPPAATLSLEVEPPFPDAARPWVVPGEPVDVTATLADDGRTALTDAALRLTVPEGWTVQPRATQRVDRVNGRGDVRVRWTVTPPADARAGDQELSVEGSWRTVAGIERRTVAQRVTVTGPPLREDTFLSDLDWAEASSGWQTVRRDREVGGGPLRLAGTTYEKGLGAATPASIVYWLGGECTRFEATIGIDDVVAAVSPDGGTATFEVWLDGRRVWSSDVISRGTATPLSVDVTGALELELRAGDAGDGGFNDRVDWAAAQVRCGGT